MGKVIFNADDFGYSRGINYGIVDAHSKGILTSTTLMTNMPGFNHAIELSKQYPDLGIGIHLTLTCGKPVLDGHKTIVDDTGKFKSLDFFEGDNEYDLNEVEKEWEAQIKKAIDANLDISHLDSHHHVHNFEKHKELAYKLARKYNLPLRANEKLPDDIVQVNRFEPNFDQVGAESEFRMRMYLANLLDDIHAYDIVEVMCHPGYLDTEVLKGSSLLENRAYVTKFMIESKFSKQIQTMDSIELVNYHQINYKK